MFRNQSKQLKPPSQKIITSKDQAIQKLIYQNSVLKKQLQEFKESRDNKYNSYGNNQNTSNIDSVNCSLQPSSSHFRSYRNSMQNSIDMRQAIPLFNNTQAGKLNNNYIINSDQNGTLQRADSNTNMRKNIQSYRHSLDMCEDLQRNYVIQEHNFLGRNLPASDNYNQSQLNTVQRNRYLNEFPAQNPHLKNNQLKVNFTEQQVASIESNQVYQQKMQKLKSKRSSHTKRLSEEKQPKGNYVSNLLTNNENKKISSFQQSHQKLKQKMLQNQENHHGRNKEDNKKIKQKQSFIKKLEEINESKSHMSHKMTTKKVQQRQIQQKTMKNFPKFSFKGQSLNKNGKQSCQDTRIPFNNQKFQSQIAQLTSLNRHSKYQSNFSSQQPTNRQNPKQLRGRIYLQEQALTHKAKTNNYKNQTNNDKQNTLKNCYKIKNSKVNTVQSQTIQVDAAIYSLVKNTPFTQLSSQNKKQDATLKKQSKNRNLVYLEIGNQNQKQQKRYKKDNSKQVNKKSVKSEEFNQNVNETNKITDKKNKLNVSKSKHNNEFENQQIISIEELHQIQNKNYLMKNKTIDKKESFSKKQKKSQQINGNTKLKSPSFTQKNSNITPQRSKRQLHNQIYVSDERY